MIDWEHSGKPKVVVSDKIEMMIENNSDRTMRHQICYISPEHYKAFENICRYESIQCLGVPQFILTEKIVFPSILSKNATKTTFLFFFFFFLE